MDLCDILIVDEKDVTQNYDGKLKDPVIIGNIYFLLLLMS
jgi:hypothetical protein